MRNILIEILIMIALISNMYQVYIIKQEQEKIFSNLNIINDIFIKNKILTIEE